MAGWRKTKAELRLCLVVAIVTLVSKKAFYFRRESHVLGVSLTNYFHDSNQITWLTFLL